MGHLGSRRRGTVLVLDHSVVELRGHSDDHVIVVRVEVPALRDVESEGRAVVVAGQEVIRVVDVSRAVGDSLGQILGPESSVGVLSVMHGEVWWPDAVMDLSLSEVPLLEEVALVFLMSRMNLAKEDHLVHQLSFSFPTSISFLPSWICHMRLGHWLP